MPNEKGELKFLWDWVLGVFGIADYEAVKNPKWHIGLVKYTNFIVFVVLFFYYTSTQTKILLIQTLCNNLTQ